MHLEFIGDVATFCLDIEVKLQSFKSYLFSNFSMLHFSLSSVKSTWKEWHLEPLSEQKCYYFTSSIRVSNTQKSLNGFWLKEFFDAILVAKLVEVYES